MEDQFEIQKELLELSIKAGRRMMHDYKHMLSEIPANNVNRQEFQQRGKIWESIFYPDNGMKNYRSELHLEIDNLRISLKIAQDLLIKHGIDPEPHLPY